MGMTVSVFRWDLGDCTNDGVSAVAGSLCVVNVRGLLTLPQPCQPFELVEGPGGRGHAIIRPVEAKKPGMVGPMFGGNYRHTVDRRFSEAVRELTGAKHLRGRADTSTVTKRRPSTKP
jgi:hypothetical protein